MQKETNIMRNEDDRIKDQIRENLELIGFTEKENYSETDFVDTIGGYFQSKGGSFKSEIWNDCLTIVADNLRAQSIEPQTKIGRIGWQFVNSDPMVSVEWDEAFHALDEIFNGDQK